MARGERAVPPRLCPFCSTFLPSPSPLGAIPGTSSGSAQQTQQRRRRKSDAFPQQRTLDQARLRSSARSIRPVSAAWRR